jgi:alpha-soluble NSF attachment protein
MSDSVAKGDDLFAKADKKLKSFGFFGNKNEEAAELLEKAANYYKLGKAWAEAARAYTTLAEVQLKLDSKHDAATAYVEGAKCAMKAPGGGGGVAMLQQAVDLYTDMGRLNMAARQLKEIGEAQEKAGAKEEAAAFYLQVREECCWVVVCVCFCVAFC